MYYFKKIFTDILLGHLVYIYIYIPITCTYHIKDFTRACAGIYFVNVILMPSFRISVLHDQSLIHGLLSVAIHLVREYFMHKGCHHFR